MTSYISSSNTLLHPPSVDFPTLVYDGDCAFCRTSVELLKQCTGPQLHYCPHTDFLRRHPSYPLHPLKQAVHLFHPNTLVTQGAYALFTALTFSSTPSICKLAHTLQYAYNQSPFFQKTSDALYAFIARHRSLFSPVALTLWGDLLPPPHTQPSTSPYALLRLFCTLLFSLFFAYTLYTSVQSLLLHLHIFVVPWLQMLIALYGLTLTSFYLFKKQHFASYLLQSGFLSLLTPLLTLFL